MQRLAPVLASTQNTVVAPWCYVGDFFAFSCLVGEKVVPVVFNLPESSRK